LDAKFSPILATKLKGLLAASSNAGKELNNLGVVAQNMLEMLLKSPTSVIVSGEEVYLRVCAFSAYRNKDAHFWRFFMFVPVVDQNQNPLMPTTTARAWRWIASGKATFFYKKGIFCVRLNVEPSDNKKQEVVVGVDPGSKKEGFCVLSEAHQFLNIQADAVTWVKDKIEARRNARRGRRFRKTPCRKNRYNRSRSPFPPSTKARWDWKLRILNVLRKLFPITIVAVEDIAAVTKKGARRWNKSFSPLEVGKKYFYEIIRSWANLVTYSGFETYETRNAMNLKKTKNKMAEVFEAHCVDAFVIASKALGIANKPTNLNIMCISPIELKRRQLHRFQPAKGGERARYGSTRSCGFKRGSLVKHPQYGYCLVGGWQEHVGKKSFRKRISLHSIIDNTRLTRDANPTDCQFKSFNSWNLKFVRRVACAAT